jgi:hypothetical protein
MIPRHFLFLICVLFLTGAAHAQLSTSLRLSKQQYLAGESVMAVVTVTNHAGQTLTFASDGRTQWLDFIMKDRRGEAVSPKGNALFGKMSIRAGETLAREVDLAQHFQLSEPGNYSVAAVVHMPGRDGDGASTNRVLFAQSPGVPYWTQKVGIPGKPGQTREYQVISFSGDEKSQIYVKVSESRTGRNISTFLLGEFLMLRKPVVAVDREQRMHVLFLATPTTWVHCVINIDGKLVGRKFHQRGQLGDPQLLTFGDGTVKVTNSVVYDQKAAADARSKVRKASDRPQIAY